MRQRENMLTCVKLAVQIVILNISFWYIMHVIWQYLVMFFYIFSHILHIIDIFFLYRKYFVSYLIFFCHFLHILHIFLHYYCHIHDIHCHILHIFCHISSHIRYIFCHTLHIILHIMHTFFHILHFFLHTGIMLPRGWTPFASLTGEQRVEIWNIYSKCAVDANTYNKKYMH